AMLRHRNREDGPASKLRQAKVSARHATVDRAAAGGYRSEVQRTCCAPAGPPESPIPEIGAFFSQEVPMASDRPTEPRPSWSRSHSLRLHAARRAQGARPWYAERLERNLRRDAPL